MTMILPAKNKADAQERLNHNRQIIKPTPWGEEILYPNDQVIGFKEPVVLDPETRRRFATIEKTATGWKVK